MKKYIFIFLAVNLIVFGIISISMAEHEIVICGTGDSQGLLRNLGVAYEKSNHDSSIKVPDSIGSGGGIKATALGKCDMGRVARTIKEKEKKYGLNYKVIAKSPVVFVVHPSVTGIDNLTAEQIIGIYSGKYTSWDQMGGPKQKVYPIGREHGDSSRSILRKKLKGFKDIEKFVSKTAYSSPETVALIENHSFTIGYGSLSMFKKTAMKVISINGIEPSEKNVNNETYGFVTNYGIVYKGELKGLARSFYDYLFTPEARKIISDSGAIAAVKLYVLEK